MRLKYQHQRHHDKLSHQRELAKRKLDAKQRNVARTDAVRLHQRDDDRRHKRTGQTTQAADHHDNEHVSDDRQIHRQVRGLARQLQRTADASQKTSQRKHGGEQKLLVHAERVRHFSILRCRAKQQAKSCFLQQHRQCEKHQNAKHNEKQVVSRKRLAQNVNCAGEPRRTRPEQIFRPPDEKRRIFDDQHQCESCD